MSQAIFPLNDSNFEVLGSVLLDPVVYEMFWQIFWFITFLNFMDGFCDTCHRKTFDGLALNVKNKFVEESCC